MARDTTEDVTTAQIESSYHGAFVIPFPALTLSTLFPLRRNSGLRIQEKEKPAQSRMTSSSTLLPFVSTFYHVALNYTDEKLEEFVIKIHQRRLENFCDDCFVQ